MQLPLKEESMPYEKLTQLIAKHAGTRSNGNVASERTYTARKESLMSSFRQLQTLGYQIQDPANLSDKHVQALMNHWLFTKKSKAKTIESNLSSLRVFGEWIGKNGMVKSKYEYASEEHHYLLKTESAARKSKSWSGNQINIQEMFNKVDAEDTQLGLILRVQISFGLRREEALKCQPHVQDFTQYLAVLKGQGKGGKPRSIPMLTSAQHELIEMVKKRTGRYESLGWQYTKDGQPASLKQNLARYNNLMQKLGLTKNENGITGHGLRAQYAENNALVHGLLPPSMGGTKNQLSKLAKKTITQILSEAMGHHREVVMSAYFCSFPKDTDETAAEKFLSTLHQCLQKLDSDELEVVDPSYRADCALIRDNIELLGIEITPKQIQFLWKIYSERNGVKWVKPERSLAVCLHASAIVVGGRLI